MKELSETNILCNNRTCLDRGKSYSCYLHSYVLCFNYPDTPDDLIHLKESELGNKISEKSGLG